MIKYFILFFFFLALTNNLSAQNPLVKQWDYRFGGTNTEFLYSFQQTKDGGYILGGTSSSNISGDKTQDDWDMTGYYIDYWIVKIDSLGNKQWDKRFGGIENDELRSVQQTSDGGYILGGYSYSDSSGDKTQHNRDTICSFSICTDDYWIVKIDSLGNKQWDKRFGGTNFDDFRCLQQTTDGGYILGGSSESEYSGDKTQPSWGGFDYWIVKIDSLGNKQWDKRFGGTDHDYFASLCQTPDDGYVLGGNSISGISGDKTQASWGWYDFWIVKTDSTGTKQWDKRFGGTDGDYPISLKPTKDGGYVIYGWSYSGIGGDKTQSNWDTICNPSCSTDYWIVKIDSSGNKQWDKRFGGTDWEGSEGSITETYDGGYLIGGVSQSPISGDKTELNLGTQQSWIVKMDSIGVKQWDKTIFTLNFDHQGLTYQTNDGCYIIASYTGSGIGGYKTQPSWGFGDYWIVKFCDTTSTVGINSPNNPPISSIYPNPFEDQLNISVNNNQPTEIILYDMLSRKLLQQEFTNSVSLSTSQLAKGIYICELRNKNVVLKKWKVVKD